MIMTRTWAMPNKDTFSIKPIGEFVQKYLAQSRVSIDPFARNKQWATYTNDLNPETSAEYHVDAEEFLKLLINKGVKADLIILDPPYSPRQIKECYDGIGIKMKKEDAWIGRTKKNRRSLINQLATEDCKVLTFGWNTNGMGKDGNWQIDEILLVAHGSDHNDTICMAESRIID